MSKEITLPEFWYERRSGRNYNDEDNFFHVRTPYERDRSRIIHCNSFRLLQAKTQLFNIGDSDFSHTRLTHTLEVSQVAKGIISLIKAKEYIPSDYVKQMFSSDLYTRRKMQPL